MTRLSRDKPGRARRNLRAPAAWTAVLGLLAQVVLTGPAAAGIDVYEELECLALTIYFEARGEPDEGKLAVGHVVMNRASHPLFPKAVCDVVRQGGDKLRYRCQFTWWCDGHSDRPTEWRAWERSKALARRIYWDYSQDPTGGALWYHAEGADPGWRHRLDPGPKIGRHVFYRVGGGWPKGGPPLRMPVGYSAD
ncbi:MAG: cell wall hydrolase [Kiloniellaceae bacterium]